LSECIRNAIGNVVWVERDQIVSQIGHSFFRLFIGDVVAKFRLDGPRGDDSHSNVTVGDLFPQ